MAAIPSFETLLLSVHEALGCNSPRKKRELREFRRNTDQHLHALAGLLDDILSAIGLDDEAKEAAKRNLIKFAQFHKALELGTWTFGAEMRQVAWYLLSWVFVPGLARHAAFWQLASTGDTGMPGGEFWYLPSVETVKGAPRLRMPVAGVLDWLEDLLGKPVHLSAVSWNNGATKVDPESAKRTLAKWRDGDVPRSSVIENYFSEGTKFQFQNCLTVASGSSDKATLDAVRTFIERRQLTPEALRHNIAMTQEGRIEAVLAGLGTSDEIQLFNQLMKDRYAQPSLRTIRNRLLLARAVQYAHREFVNLLSPGVPPVETDPCQNKILQLVEIYKQVYNLTIQAAAMSEDASQQDDWFEGQLAPWERDDLFLAILPSRRHTSALELPEILTSRFASLQPGQPLENWRVPDADQTVMLIRARQERWAAVLEDVEAINVALLALRTRPQQHALAAITSIAAARTLAIRHDATAIRIAAARRMAKLASTDDQSLDATLIQLDIYLSVPARPEPAETQSLVEALLRAAEANPARCRRMPQLLNARAKHCLRSNDFQQARTFFREALEACSGDSCADLPGLIARDLFALDSATKPNGYHVTNHERHVRIMAAFNVINGLHYPIADVEKQLAAYFWSDLYHPYPGLQSAGVPHRTMH